MKPRTAAGIYDRAVTRALANVPEDGHLGLLDIMQCVDTCLPSPETDGRRSIIITNETCEAYRASYHTNYTNLPMETARDIGLTIKKSSAYQLAHNVGLSPHRPRLKPRFKPNHMRDRVIYAQCGLLVPLECFIFTDEMWLRVGAPSKRLRNVWRPPGSDSYEYIVHKDKGAGFSLMIHASIAMGYKGSLTIWQPETDEERAANKAEVTELNKERANWVQTSREQAKITGTPE